MAEFVRVVAVTDLPPGSCKQAEVAGTAVAIFNVDGQFYATTGTCPHRGGPLGEGSLDGCYVSCPWHDWAFDVITGAHARNSEFCLGTYPVRVDNGQVLVKVE